MLKLLARFFKKKQESIHKKIHLINQILFFLAVGGTLLTLPVVYKVWTSIHNSDVSIITWVSLSLIAICWLIYGLIKKNKPIFINSLCVLILYLLIITGALLNY